jgi:hypothetical protein
MGKGEGHRSRSARLTDHLRSNVVGYIALFVALSGTALALPGKNTVDSGDIKKKSVETSDLAPNAVKGSRLAPGAVTSASVADGALAEIDLARDSIGGGAVDESTLGEVPSAANAGQLGGVGPSGYLRYGSTIPSGVTISGVFTSADEDDNGVIFARDSESFPLPAPADLTDADVNFAPSSTGGDDDASCTGSFHDPSAPPGKVCIYPGGGNCSQDGSSTGVALFGGGTRSRFGFGINGPACSVSLGNAHVNGTWAYTAP